MKPKFVRCRELVKKISDLALEEFPIEVVRDERGYHLFARVEETGELIELAENLPFVLFEEVE
jgi:hypothetical protein